MIDWDKSAELNNCLINVLKVWLEKYPKSNKRVVGICDDCGSIRESHFSDYHSLCLSCSHKTPEFRKKISKAAIKRFSDPNELKSHLKRITLYWSDPKIKAMKSKQMLQYYKDNPDDHTDHYQNMRGGNDIVNHHWLYDDADLSKYTMPMTRSDHMSMHRRMQIDGYVVPHINSETDDNGLWGYH